MNRLEENLQKLKLQGRKAFIPYVVAGDPSLDVTADLVVTMAEAGADAIELGIPYSDPVADGPVIQRAGKRALTGGVTLEAIFTAVRAIRKRTEVPLIFMVYMNCILQYGVEKFARQCKEFGVDGLIVPDMPLEESDELRHATADADLAVILLVTPATPKERMVRITQASRGFVYCVAALGVTGMRQDLRSDLGQILTDLKSMTDLPIAVGFGISTPDQAAQLAPLADGVIVGSAVVRLMEEEQSVAKVAQFVQSMKAAITN